MTKKSIVAVLLILLSIGILSLYRTYALDNDALPLSESIEEENLIFNASETSNRQVTLSPKETKLVDIELTNTYENNIKTNLFYYAVDPDKLPDNVNISLASTSEYPLENILKPSETKTVSIKIENNSEYNVVLIIGALVGFENADIKELETDKQILIK